MNHHTLHVTSPQLPFLYLTSAHRPLLLVNKQTNRMMGWQNCCPGKHGACPVLLASLFTFQGFEICIKDKKMVDPEYSQPFIHSPSIMPGMVLCTTWLLPQSPWLRDESGLQIPKPSIRSNMLTSVRADQPERQKERQRRKKQVEGKR